MFLLLILILLTMMMLFYYFFYNYFKKFMMLFFLSLFLPELLWFFLVSIDMFKYLLESICLYSEYYYLKVVLILMEYPIHIYYMTPFFFFKYIFKKLYLKKKNPELYQSLQEWYILENLIFFSLQLLIIYLFYPYLYIGFMIFYSFIS